MRWLKDLKRDLQNLGQVPRPRDERRPATGLAARYGLDTPSTPADIKDISTSGIYLFTEKRLRTGELITLTLQEEGLAENSSELQISLHARVARLGEDGAGLSFVLPPGLDTNLWGVLVRNIVMLTDADQIAHMFRTLRAILFLCSLCGSEAEQAILLLGGQLNSERTESAIKLALAAEDLLASDPDAGRLRIHPTLVTNLLREASWTPDEVLRQLWAGLLVSSCSADAPDDSNQIFINLLIQLTPVQSKILCYACERTLGSGPGSGASASVVLNPKQMVELTGWSDLTRNATDAAYLFNLGVIQHLFDFTSYREIDNFDITPSTLGIQLYKHCNGHREKVDQQLVDAANAHLVNFLPPAHPLDFSSPSSSISSSGD
jgi:hypothetical protein